MNIVWAALIIVAATAITVTLMLFVRRGAPEGSYLAAHREALEGRAPCAERLAGVQTGAGVSAPNRPELTASLTAA